jgi:plasmid stabilization system protein ParE
MSRAILRRPQARRDLLEIADFIARASLEASDRFLDAAEAAFRLLANMPEMGTLCRFKSPLTQTSRPVWL